MTTIISGDTGISPVTASGTSASIDGMTVGRGGGELSSNTAVGLNALAGANSGNANNTAVGQSALGSNTTGAYNSAFGLQALANNTTGQQLVSVGRNSLSQNTTGSYNTACGHDALSQNTTASYSVAAGYQAGFSNTTGNITAFGSKTLYSNTTGTDNTAVGGNYNASAPLYANTTGSYNIAVGTGALTSNTTASNNTAVGYQARYSNTTGVGNTAVGYQAGYSGASANYNAHFGQQTGFNSTGSNNTFIGCFTGYSVTTGQGNTFIGTQGSTGSYGAGYYVTTGNNNTIIGSYTGNQGGLDIRTASNYIVLSDGDGNPRAWIGAGNNNDLFRVGTASTSTASWMHQMSYSQTSRYIIGFTNDTTAGNPNGIAISYPNTGAAGSTDSYLSCSNNAGARAYIKNDGGFNNYQANNSNLSDRREKTNFALAKDYLSVVCSIPVQTFNYIDQDMEDDSGLTLGVVAQDVQEVAPELVTEANWGTKEEPKMRLSIYQTDLQYALMKSIQELKALVDAQATEIAKLKAR